MLIWLSPIAILTARMVWQRRPGLFTCALFWTISVVFIVLLDWSITLSQLLLTLGLVLNAVVTLANGGFMPVATQRRLGSNARSLWVQRESGQRFLFLADNYGTRFIRFSVGDTFLLFGIILSFFGL
jgi:hypothetical protein